MYSLYRLVANAASPLSGRAGLSHIRGDRIDPLYDYRWAKR